MTEALMLIWAIGFVVFFLWDVLTFIPRYAGHQNSLTETAIEASVWPAVVAIALIVYAVVLVRRMARKAREALDG